MALPHVNRTVTDGLTRQSATRDQLDAAVELWRGPFLEGFDLRDCSGWDEWLYLERAA